MTPERAGKAEETDENVTPVEETDADASSEEAAVGTTDETEAVEDSPQILTREDLFDPNKTHEVETQVVAGMVIRGLSSVELHQVQTALSLAMRDAKHDSERLTNGDRAEQAMLLAKGVVEPALQYDEWRHVQKKPGWGGRLKTVSSAIQLLSGVMSWAEELAGKVSRSDQSDTDE